MADVHAQRQSRYPPPVTLALLPTHATHTPLAARLACRQAHAQVVWRARLTARPPTGCQEKYAGSYLSLPLSLASASSPCCADMEVTGFFIRVCSAVETTWPSSHSSDVLDAPRALREKGLSSHLWSGIVLAALRSCLPRCLESQIRTR